MEMDAYGMTFDKVLEAIKVHLKCCTTPDPRLGSSFTKRKKY